MLYGFSHINRLNPFAIYKDIKFFRLKFQHRMFLEKVRVVLLKNFSLKNFHMQPLCSLMCIWFASYFFLDPFKGGFVVAG